MTDEIPKAKNVHILVPKGFQGKELMRGQASNLESGIPANGECMKCRGTGAIPHKVWLEDVVITDGRIAIATPKIAFEKCRCYLGQFWIRFHPVNVQARIFPKWGDKIREMLEQEKAKLIRESGGNYDPGQDTFLRDTNYKPPVKQKIFSLDQIVRDSLAKKGDFI